MKTHLLLSALLFCCACIRADSIVIPEFGTVHFESMEGPDYRDVSIQDLKHPAFTKIVAESMRYDPSLREIALTKATIHVADGSVQRSEFFQIKLPQSDPNKR